MGNPLFKLVLRTLEEAFQEIEIQVPPPVPTPWRDGFVFRYKEKTVQQAVVQKLARIVSGLHAIDVLLERGLFQEQGVMQRAVAEIQEDVWFLAIGIIKNDLTDRHTEFLQYFYAEEFSDPSDVVGSHSSRGMVSREKVRNYINQAGLSPSESARAKLNDRILTKAYSGFVHAASPHIMDMYAGVRPRADVSGSLKKHRFALQQNDAANYFYRGILTMALAAQAFSDEKLYRAMRNFADEMEAGGLIPAFA
jgi:hypothetical protein